MLVKRALTDLDAGYADIAPAHVQLARRGLPAAGLYVARTRGRRGSMDGPHLVASVIRRHTTDIVHMVTVYVAERPSLYDELAEPAPAGARRGETIGTKAKETLDNDVETFEAAEFAIHGHGT